MVNIREKLIGKMSWFSGKKILIGLAVVGGIFFVVNDPWEWQKKEKIDLWPLQFKIQNLQEKVQGLEEKIVTLKNQPPVPTGGQSTGAAMAFFLFERLMTEYYQHQPFKTYLERLLSLPPIKLEKSDDIRWLLTYGVEGTPSTEVLLGLLDTADPKPEKAEIKFFENPRQYLASLIDWDTLFHIRSSKQVALTDDVRGLIIKNDFSKALAVLEVSKENHTALKQALTALIRSRSILNHLEQRLLKELSKGAQI